MSWNFSWYLLPLVIAAVTTFVLAYFAFRNRDKRTAPQVVGILLGAAIWATADAVALSHTSESVMVFCHNVRLVGSTLLVLSVFLFALEYTNREQWLRRRYVGCLLLPFVVTVVLAWTETTLFEHGLIRTDVTLVETVGLVVTDFDFGIWFWINAAYSYGLLLLALVCYLLELVRKDATTYRKQTIVLAASLVIPWFMNGLYLAEITPVDLTGAGLAVTGVLFYASLFWLSLLDLIPIGRGTVLEHIEHGVLVVDTGDTIVDCNDRMAEFVGLPRDRLIGATTTAVYADYPELLERFGDERDAEGTFSMDRDGELRHYEVELSPIYSRTDRYIGRTILVRDNTEQVRRQRQLRDRTEELERQNERLDEFAGIVSHDLRNPLTVANGYLELAREQVDLEELAVIDESHERMEEIIEDVLALARQADDVETTGPVDLASVVEESWQSVDAPEGSLVVRCDRTVEANRSRLKQLLENLMRNTYDHGPATATITVGDFDDRDGFYVEDDGPGISVDDPASIFEEGYTTAADGTGLGLSIVRSIADAHGWTVRVTDGRNGGARFEFTGVASVEERRESTARRERVQSDDDALT